MKFVIGELVSQLGECIGAQLLGAYETLSEIRKFAISELEVRGQIAKFSFGLLQCGQNFFVD